LYLSSRLCDPPAAPPSLANALWRNELTVEINSPKDQHIKQKSSMIEMKSLKTKILKNNERQLDNNNESGDQILKKKPDHRTAPCRSDWTTEAPRASADSRSWTEMPGRRSIVTRK